MYWRRYSAVDKQKLMSSSLQAVPTAPSPKTAEQAINVQPLPHWKLRVVGCLRAETFLAMDRSRGQATRHVGDGTVAGLVLGTRSVPHIYRGPICGSGGCPIQRPMV